MENSNFQKNNKPNKKVKIKYKNVAVALALVIVLLYAIVSCTVSVFTKKDDKPKKKPETSQSDKDSISSESEDNKDNTESSSDNNTEQNNNQPTKVPPEQVLQNAAFIGDSRMKGLVLYNNLTTVKDYTDIGLNVETAVTKEFVPNADGTTTTIKNALTSAGEIERIYFCLGINELGWPSIDGFIKKYTELINMVREVQPKSEIYVMAILPVTKERSDTDAVFNNNKINQVNAEIKKMTENLGVKYLDCRSAVSDESGNLVAQASTDGIHLIKEYCEKWLECIKNNP